MKKSILFIHGAGDDAWEWTEPFIAPMNNLNGHYQFIFPKMPSSESGGYKAWKEKIISEIKNLNSDSIIIGHSLGASVLLKLFFEGEQQSRFDSLYLIAAPFWGEPDWDVDEFMLRENFSKHLPQFEKIYLLHNEDDEFVPFAHRDVYAKNLKTAKILPSKHHGHLSAQTMEQVADQIREDHKI